MVRIHFFIVKQYVVRKLNIGFKRRDFTVNNKCSFDYYGFGNVVLTHHFYQSNKIEIKHFIFEINKY